MAKPLFHQRKPARRRSFVISRDARPAGPGRAVPAGGPQATGGARFCAPPRPAGVWLRLAPCRSGASAVRAIGVRKKPENFKGPTQGTGARV